jgi:hypothetical protein
LVRWLGGSHVVRILLVSVALLLPAGVLSASAVDRPSPTGAGAGPTELAEPRVPDTSSTTSTALDVEAPPTTAGSSTTATTRRPTTPTTRQPAPATTRPPTPTTTIPRRPTRTIIPPSTIAPASAWQAEREGVSARMRIEPATPVAGEPVRFVIEVSSADPCCHVMLDFGDGSGRFTTNPFNECPKPSSFSPGPHSFETTHVFAEPRPRTAMLLVMAGDVCVQSPSAPASSWLHSVTLSACIAVGPGPGGQTGCTR